MKSNIFISNVCAPFENLLHAHSEKKASCLAYFGQKFPKMERSPENRQKNLPENRQKNLLIFHRDYFYKAI